MKILNFSHSCYACACAPKWLGVKLRNSKLNLLPNKAAAAVTLYIILMSTGCMELCVLLLVLLTFTQNIYNTYCCFRWTYIHIGERWRWKIFQLQLLVHSVRRLLCFVSWCCCSCWRRIGILIYIKQFIEWLACQNYTSFSFGNPFIHCQSHVFLILLSHGAKSLVSANFLCIQTNWM